MSPAERGGPRVEGPQIELGEQVGGQVALHDPELGHRVGDRSGGGEGDHPRAVGAAQRPELGVEVLRALGTDPGDAVDRRVDPAVLIGMCFVHFTALPTAASDGLGWS